MITFFCYLYGLGYGFCLSHYVREDMRDEGKLTLGSVLFYLFVSLIWPIVLGIDLLVWMSINHPTWLKWGNPLNIVLWRRTK